MTLSYSLLTTTAQALKTPGSEGEFPWQADRKAVGFSVAVSVSYSDFL